MKKSLHSGKYVLSRGAFLHSTYGWNLNSWILCESHWNYRFHSRRSRCVRVEWGCWFKTGTNFIGCWRRLILFSTRCRFTVFTFHSCCFFPPLLYFALLIWQRPSHKNSRYKHGAKTTQILLRKNSKMALKVWMRNLLPIVLFNCWFSLARVLIQELQKLCMPLTFDRCVMQCVIRMRHTVYKDPQTNWDHRLCYWGKCHKAKSTEN